MDYLLSIKKTISYALARAIAPYCSDHLTLADIDPHHCKIANALAILGQDPAVYLNGVCDNFYVYDGEEIYVLPA